MADAALGDDSVIVNDVAMIVRGPRRVPRRRMVEVRIEGVREMAYDEDLLMTVTGPAGLSTTVPAFWRADREGVGWHVRFTPPLAGQWELVAVDGTVRSTPLRMTVSDDAHRGFVRVDGDGFRYENGDPFVPAGPELPEEGTLDDYRAFFARLQREGATATRLRLSPEWTILVERSWLIDKILELAAAHGIGVMVTLGNRLTAATEEELMRLRYVGARWSAYPSVWSWQWWDDTGGDDAALHAWIALVTPYLRGVDAHNHPVTTGYDSRIKTAIWGLPELDFASCRLGTAADPVLVMPALAAKQRRIAAGKPVVLSFTGKEPDVLPAALFSGFAGVVTDSGFEPFASLSGLRLAGLKPSVPLKGACLALVGPESAVAWVRAPVAFTLRGLADGPYAATWSALDGSVVRTDSVAVTRGAVRLSATAPSLVRLTRPRP
jgi:hypothetical protein